MKRVVINKEANEIDIKDVSRSSFIGIENQYGEKHFPIDNQNRDYFVASIDCISKNYELRIFDTLNELIEALIPYGWRVFVFDSRKELKEWLLKD